MRELQSMSQDDLDQLLTYTWKGNDPRGDCIGITDLKIEQNTSQNNQVWYDVVYSNYQGEPSFTIDNLDEKIGRVESNCMGWSYGVYKKKQIQ